jgi:hypothetical protein
MNSQWTEILYMYVIYVRSRVRITFPRSARGPSRADGAATLRLTIGHWCQQQQVICCLVHVWQLARSLAPTILSPAGRPPRRGKAHMRTL